jgi:hypothetical protein
MTPHPIEGPGVRVEWLTQSIKYLLISTTHESNGFAVFCTDSHNAQLSDPTSAKRCITIKTSLSCLPTSVASHGKQAR